LGLDPGIECPCRWPASSEYRWKEDHRRGFPRRAYSFRNPLDQWSPLQVNAPQLPVLHNPYIIILPQGPEIRSVLPYVHVISLSHSGLGSEVSFDFPNVLQSVCQRHSLTFSYVGLPSIRTALPLRSGSASRRCSLATLCDTSTVCNGL